MFQDKKLLRHSIAVLIGFLLALLINCGWAVIEPIIEPSIIIKYHHAGLQALQKIIKACSFGAGCIIGSSIFFTIKDVRRIKAEKKPYGIALQQVESQLEEERRKFSLETPEGIHNYVARLLERPAIHPTVATILDQLRQMDELQERLNELFTVNGIVNLGDASKLLQDVEDALCMVSTKRLISYYIVGGETMLLNHSERVIADNELLLEQARGVLKDIVEYINGDKTINDVTSHIKVFQKTIQNFIQEEKDNDSQSQEDFGDFALPAGGN